jgi:DNA polymerase I-like protein with 3'-5' exonuclease and polymerase domains
VQFGADEMKKPLSKHESAAWCELLQWELGQLPNLKYVIVCGNLALEALYGVTGISHYRGSVLNAMVGGRPVRLICMNNPAMLIRDPRSIIPFNMDAEKLKKVLAGEFVEHLINVHINPSFKEAMQWLDMMQRQGKPVASDIETMQMETACIGFANSAHEAMCIPFRTIDGHWFTQSEELAIRQKVQTLYSTTSRVKHVMQNGHFDCSWLGYKDKILVSPIYFDTMLAHHTLYPTLPHNLGFLTTQYTNHPYYKDEKDDWKKTGGIDQYWTYNGKDCAITHAVAEKELQELREEKLDKFFFEHVMRLQWHLVQMTIRGIKVDVERKAEIHARVSADVDRRMEVFHAAVAAATGEPDYKPNPKSPKQLSELYFTKLQLTGRGHSTDKENRDLMYKHNRTTDEARAVIKAHNEYAKEQKYFSTYVSAGHDPDHRMRSVWSQIGVQEAPGRLSSSGTLWDTGGNMQNIPGRVKELFIADEGYVFVYFDSAQAEARIVGWRYRIAKWIEQFERARRDGVYDAHRALASEMFGIPYDDVPTFDHYDLSEGHPPPVGKEDFSPTIRYISKRCRHGLNYRMQPDRLSLTTGLPYMDSLDAFQKYHAATPELRVGWRHTEEEVKRNRTLFNAYGRRYLQLEEPTPETLDSIVAFYPQSTLGDHVSRVIYKSHDDPKWPSHAAIVLNIHDALIALVRKDQAVQALRVMMKHAETPINIVSNVYEESALGVEKCVGTTSTPLIIPADAAISQPDYVGQWGPLKEGLHRWSTIRKIKRKELGI